MNLRQCLLISLLLVSTFLISCNKEDDPIPEPDLYPALSTYTDRFLAEAKARGFDLNLSDLDVQYINGEIIEAGKNFCGYGYQTLPTTGRRTVLISKASRCNWANLSNLQRERFFFHEIGHAVLNLQHDESFLCDGSPATLMHPNVHSYDYYEDDPESKKYYLDELFDRLAAEDQCIDYKQDWATDPVYFKHKDGDQLWNFSDAKGNLTGSRSTQSSPYSLIISSILGKTSTENGYWFTQLPSPNIPQGAKVTLRTKVNSDGLAGPGVAIALRVYETQILSTGAQTIESYVVSSENQPATGKLTDYILEVSLPSFTRKSIYFIPFAVMLAGTAGKVQFDDFEIIVEE